MNTKEIVEKLSVMHPNAGCELQYKTPFELLVAVILSAQCTDKRVNIAAEKLFQVYNTPWQFAELTLEELKPYIFSCGFYNNKGKNILSMSRALVANYNGEVPRDFEKLIALDGVGRKTAQVVMAVAFDMPAMPVDTHVFRVARRLGLSVANQPEGVERDLKAKFPPEEWNRMHHNFIFHGRYICHSQKPECEKCLLKEGCPYYNGTLTIQVK